MGKVKKNSAIDQVMDELNEEAKSSLQPSPDLFNFHSLNESDDHLGEQNQKNTTLASLIHFTPGKIGREEQKENQNPSPDEEIPSPKQELNRFSIKNNPPSKKKEEAKGVGFTPDKGVLKKRIYLQKR